MITFLCHTEPSFKTTIIPSFLLYVLLLIHLVSPVILFCIMLLHSYFFCSCHCETLNQNVSFLRANCIQKFTCLSPLVLCIWIACLWWRQERLERMQVVWSDWVGRKRGDNTYGVCNLTSIVAWTLSIWHTSKYSWVAQFLIVFLSGLSCFIQCHFLDLIFFFFN